jgi:hypothetical protein
MANYWLIEKSFLNNSHIPHIIFCSFSSKFHFFRDVALYGTMGNFRIHGATLIRSGDDSGAHTEAPLQCGPSQHPDRSSNDLPVLSPPPPTHPHGLKKKFKNSYLFISSHKKFTLTPCVAS